jgi:tetratricopeptide (TPR) repeat protein
MTMPIMRTVVLSLALLAVLRLEAAERPSVTLESLREAADDFRALPESVQELQSQRARAVAKKWLEHIDVAALETRPGGRINQGLWRALNRRRTGDRAKWPRIMPEAEGDLGAALRADPTYLFAHVALVRICYETGRRSRAIAHAEFIHHEVLGQSTDVALADLGVAGAIAYEAAIPLAWSYRELGQWERGLGAVDWARRYRQARGLEASGPLDLLHGLLLAGAGRGSEALGISRSLLVNVPKWRWVGHKQFGLKREESIYAQDWVQSQVFLHEGDMRLALRRSDRDRLERRKIWYLMPYYAQYWNDMGLLFELNGDPVAAAGCYLQMNELRPDWSAFFDRGRARSTQPLIAGLPSPHVVYFQTEAQDYLWGSPLAYAADQYRRLERSADLDAVAARGARTRILQMLQSLGARRVAPGFCHALRGRIAYLDADLATAEDQLERALASFADQGVQDPETRLILGLVKYGLGKDDEAQDLLVEATGHATALQGLGVILARKGEHERALQCLDRALELDPWSATARFNRGMLHYQQGRFAAAREDLLLAFELAPELSQEIAPWLQRVATYMQTTIDQ